MSAARSWSDDGDRVPHLGLQPSVLVLSGHEVGGDDRAGGRLPALVGGDDGVADVQLTEEGDGVAVAVAAPARTRCVRGTSRR